MQKPRTAHEAPRRRSSRALVLLALALAAAAPAQVRRDAAFTDYHERRNAALAEAGQRHLRLGSWARDQGLVPQATAQFLRAVEVSEGRNPGAVRVLAILRGLGDAFWTAERKRPSRALLADYARRAAALDRQTRADHLDLARRAARAGLEPQQKEHYRAVLELGGGLEVDARGDWRLEGKVLPAELAEWLREITAAPAEGPPVFEAAGVAAPRLQNLTVHEDRALRVRTDLPGDAAARLHALGTALFPHLRERLDGEPVRQLVLTVFASAADYAGYLAARGLGRHAAVPGLCDYGTFQTLVAAEGLQPADLDALVLHELTHLFFFGTAPAVMPDWYAEGFAETFGGQGTFAWDGTTLTVGGLLRRDRIDDLKAAPLPLRELVDVSAAALLAGDRPRGQRFYAQCWALQRFLQQEDCPWGPRFCHFEALCRGRALGSPESGRPAPNPVPAGVEFRRLFGDDLDRLDEAFRAWLAGL